VSALAAALALAPDEAEGDVVPAPGPQPLIVNSRR